MRIKIALAVVCLTAFVAIAQEKPAAKPDVPPQSAKPEMRPISINLEQAKLFDDAASRVEETRRIVEASPAFKDWVIAQNQLQTTQFYIMAELGLKPKDG